MTTAPFVSPSLPRLHSARASPFPKPSVGSGGGVAFPARTYGSSLRLRSAVMSASGVGGNGSPMAPEESTVSSRLGEVKRVTKETNVHVKINLDGTGVANSSTGIPFLDHMLDALLQALGDRKGINRFGHFTAPLDEAAVEVILDLSGRPHLSCGLSIPTERVGTYDTQLVEHFFQSLVNTSGMTLHIRQLAGNNSHHIIEATFKAFARALRQATEYDLRRQGTIPRFVSSLTANIVQGNLYSEC
uniref:imidazoleglycerol-phosphate dehydratase n=1 Tax=Aegilops tauschii subsp. strangulata TaxID=200361 RepID=A0A453CYV2_AEGTS